MTTREERAKARALKRKKQKLVTFFGIFLIIIIAVLVVLGILMNRLTPDEIRQSENTTESAPGDGEVCRQSFLASAKVLKDYIFESEYGDRLESEIKKELGNSFNASLTVFLSVSDGSSAAYVVNGSGATLTDAWNAAEKKMGDVVSEKLLNAVYVKADFVNSMERILSSELSARISAESGIYGEFFRKGIAFDGAFSSALLESEINSNELIDYDITKNLVMEKVNLYLSAAGCAPLSGLPENIYLFSCRGYMKDADGCYMLSYENNSSYGRRLVQTVDYTYITQMASFVAGYMLDNMSADGKFTYGIYPVIGLPIEQYDIAYHSMALSSLLSYAKKLDSAGLYEDKIECAVQYLLSQIVEKDADTVYVANIANGEITAGGNIHAIIALCDYQNTYGSSAYAGIAKQLGNGLLAMFDVMPGKPNHVLYYKSGSGADFAVKNVQTDRTFDSGAIYALCRLYEITQEEKYLNAASSLADVLIKENYAQYADCWVTAAMEELTKYNKKAEYYNFALKNFNDNINALETRVISMPQYTRLLVGTYNVYAAMQAEKVTTELFTAFDHDRLVNATVARANDLLNGIAYPEFSMYFRNPNQCTRAFFVRQDGFRIRIDDMALFLQAYLCYAEKYTAISADALNIALKAAAATTPQNES